MSSLKCSCKKIKGETTVKIDTFMKILKKEDKTIGIKNGLIYRIIDDGEILYLHHFIAEDNIPRPSDPLAIKVRHIDNNKLNNARSNLEWVRVEDLRLDQMY